MKNDMQMTLSTVNPQKVTAKDSDTFCKALETRISAMKTVHKRLYRSPEVPTIEAESPFEDPAEFASAMYHGSSFRPGALPGKSLGNPTR